MSQDTDEVVAALIPALDNLRRGWLSQVLERCSGTHPIVHKKFSREIDLGIPEDDLPETFPFNRFDGEAAEGLILNWQLQVAIQFSGQRGYLELESFVGPLMKHGKDDPLWLRTLGSFFSSEPLKPEHASLHLAQYLLANVEQTAQVQDLGENLCGFLYILTLTTQATVAQAFGDAQESARCTAAIGALTASGNKSDTPAAPASPKEKSGCFIATAVYGSSEAREVRVLREFRDAVLVNSMAGRGMICIYYLISPHVARILSGNERLRSVVKALLLEPIISRLSARRSMVGVKSGSSAKGQG
jgi:hypothetical protein